MKTETYTLLAFGIYVPVVTVAALAVARLIFRHGNVFLVQGFRGDTEIAAASGSLLRTQFILTVTAVMMLTLQFADYDRGYLLIGPPADAPAVFEVLSLKIGVMLLLIGALHFLLLRRINRIRATGSIF